MKQNSPESLSSELNKLTNAYGYPSYSKNLVLKPEIAPVLQKESIIDFFQDCLCKPYPEGSFDKGSMGSHERWSYCAKQ